MDSPLNYCMRRSGSDEEFLRRVGLIRFRRAGSEEMTVESGGSTPSGKKGQNDGFKNFARKTEPKNEWCPPKPK